MKKIFLFTLFVFSFAFSKGQGNLQFNQVKFYEFAVTQVGATTFTESPQSVTVPTGKVWKIESAVSNNYSSTSNGSFLATASAGMMLLNNKVLFQSYITNSSTYFSQPILPMWLPPGTYTFSIKSSALSNGVQFVGAVSIIEFNVVP